MLTILARRLIPNHENYADSAVRGAYGTLCGVMGIVLNILLFAGKYLAGLLAGSVAVMADAFNNLADAGSSIITLLGFRLAALKPDPRHPFGHGRMEYMSGLVVSILIILVGYQLARDALHQILHPEPVEAGLLTVGILVASIAVKLYIYAYNKSIGGKINSPGMQATAMDSLTDSVSTLVVLFSMGLNHFAHVNADGWCGLLVACFILYTGVKSTIETLNPLLGSPADPEYVQQIRDIVLGFDDIVNVHDLMVHDYGPGRCIVSLHAEVPGTGDIFQLHDSIDRAEVALHEQLGCIAVIHMDPVTLDDPRQNEMHRAVCAFAERLEKGVTVHDFRMVEGPTHTNVIFDAVLPFGANLEPDELTEFLRDFVEASWPNTYAVVHIDRPFN